ncbi:MAG: IPT/TIG domain-containing protein [Betaproteobacteria bacterium]|nr:IPT/TIG domain-containing protein [Betaproteobacteria bacterium]
MAANNVVEYVYDLAGNVTQIRRQPVAGIAVTGVEPGSGPVGSVVTIYGAGFSAVPGENTVQFNGVAATVGAADAGSLSVTVPSGATSGHVSVPVGASSAVSPAAFQVTIPGAPTVTGFTPGIGPAGTAVSVSGSGFDPAPGATTVGLAGAPVAASVLDATSISFTVPAGRGSGRISATNAAGTGASSQDFIVTPATYAPADIATSLRLAPGGASGTLAIGTPSSHGVVLFDGTADVHYTAQFSQLATSPTNARVDYVVYKPDNTVLKSGIFGMAWDRPTIHLPRLPASGTYAIFVSPGAATLSTSASVAADPVVAIDGPMVAIAPPGTWQSARSVFAVSAAQRIGIGVGGFTLTPHLGSGTNFRVYQPDGTQLGTGGQANCYAAAAGYSALGNCDGELVGAAAGTYTMVSETAAGTRASYSLQLSADVAGTLSPDVPQDVAISRLGQDGYYTFTAATGDNLAVEVFGVVPASEAKPFNFSVFRPNGTPATSGSAASPSWAAVSELGTIATGGTYAVVVDPYLGAYGNARIALRQGAMLGTVDPPAAFATATVGESVRYRFAGSIGQRLTVGIDSLAYVGTSSSTTALAVFKPDGTSFASVGCLPTSAGGRCKINLPVLAIGGTYSVRITPPAGVRVSGNVALSDELTGTLVAGVGSAISVSRPGQNVRYSFSGTAGESTAVELSQLSTTPSGQYLYMYIYRPDGTQVTYAGGASTGVFANLPALPVTWTYSVLLDADKGVPFTAQLKLKPGTRSSSMARSRRWARLPSAKWCAMPSPERPEAESISA